MLYRVIYTNPNNIIRTDPYVFETRSKAELNEFLADARRYSGSYNILSNEKISEAKGRQSSMGAKPITFAEFLTSTEGKEGIVCLGCGGDINEWIKGVSSSLHEGKVVVTSSPSKLWSAIYTMTSAGGRIDLVFVMNQKAKFDFGKMAMWRIQFGDCSWISDFKVNYADHY